MRNGLKEDQPKPYRRAGSMFRYLNIVMALFYLLMGALVAFSSLFATVEIQTRWLMGAILGIYGLFRFYRVFSQK